jgi:hypothetical protein
MSDNIFADQSYGQIALKKLSPVPENFRLFSVAWLGDDPRKSEVMKVTGAEFRVAKSGPRKGKLCILIKGTQRTAYVTVNEMQEFEEVAND